VAYEQMILHAFRLPHVVSTFRVIQDLQPATSRPTEASIMKRGRLKTVAGIYCHYSD